MHEWTGLRFDFTTHEIVATRRRNGARDELPYRMLSDGQRTTLAMVADLAYRAAVLNPHFGRQATEETEGLVLIDELDLHLHPKWQRTIVNALKRGFPRFQFVATSHSPFIVQALEAQELIQLDRPDVQIPGGPDNRPEAGEPSILSIEDIAEQVLKVPNPQWSERRKEMWNAAQEYYKLVRADAPDPQKSEALRRLQELSRPFSEDVALQALLALEPNRGQQ
jgi:predicted ATP-binding protein involved in virulence